MIRRFAIASALSGLIIAGAAHAGELTPMAGQSVALGDVLGIAYYTVEEDGYRVVATVTSGENTTPVRFIATLKAGQKTILSVPRAPGLSALTVEIARIGDRVTVSEGEKLTHLGLRAE